MLRSPYRWGSSDPGYDRAKGLGVWNCNCVVEGGELKTSLVTLYRNRNVSIVCLLW